MDTGVYNAAYYRNIEIHPTLIMCVWVYVVTQVYMVQKNRSVCIMSECTWDCPRL